MQPSNTRYRIAIVYRSILCIFLEERVLLRARALPSNCCGAFFLVVRGFSSMDEERKEERGGGPRSSSEKIGSRHRVDDSPLSRKRLHRRREPSPALFQHFAGLFYLTRVRLSCDWIIQIPFSILSPLVATRTRNPALSLFPALLSARIVSIQRFSPSDNFPSRFLLRCYCLYQSHIRAKDAVIVSRGSPQFQQIPFMQQPNVAVPNGRVWAKAVVAVCST